MKTVGAALLSCMAGPALALSCMAPDVAQTFKALDDAPESFVVVHGKLTFDETLLPVTDWDNQEATPPSTPIPARLTGKSLTHGGFTAPFDHDITFDAVCFGPWCVSAASGSDVMAFVEYTGGEYVFGLGPCYFTGFFNPKRATLNQAAACFRGEACERRFQ
ncbi:MAG: hypothetical protein AAFZ04_09780 [Pseudomonadota bacterium]